MQEISKLGSRRQARLPGPAAYDRTREDPAERQVGSGHHKETARRVYALKSGKAAQK